MTASGECGHFRFTDDTPGINRLGLGIPAGQYQRLGYAVLPLVRGGKRPHRMLGERGGVHHASLAVADVKRWWGADQAANIGVATGSTSRLVVLDLDVKSGKNGIAELTRFMVSYWLDLPAGPFASTPSGGRHIWLRTPAGLVIPERPGILPAVDIKGDGGFVVAPPSMKPWQSIKPDVPGTGPVLLSYDWNGCPCSAPDAPPWLLRWLSWSPARGERSLPDDSALDAGELARTGIRCGERNVSLYRLACSLYRKHGSGAARTVMGVIRAVWQAGDVTGFPWSEVLTIADSARRFVAGQEAKDEQIRQQAIRWLGGTR